MSDLLLFGSWSQFEEQKSWICDFFIIYPLFFQIRVLQNYLHCNPRMHERERDLKLWMFTTVIVCLDSCHKILQYT
jgi:hypothetical protein